MVDGAKIKRMMDSMNITQEEMAEEACISGGMMSYIINGKKSPNIETVVIIAKRLGCKVDDLLVKEQ